jgi:hypothetical protein
MRLKVWIFAVLACAAVPPAVAGAKLAGKVLDAAALSKVRAYCVDTSNLKRPFNQGDLPQAEAFDVRALVRTESGPKGLLRKLPWKLEADCSSPGVDAIVRFDFRTIAGLVIVEPRPPNPPTPPEWPSPDQLRWLADLQVTDKASSRAIYRAQGNPLDQPDDATVTKAQHDHDVRRAAAYHAFSALISDLKAISKNP